MTDRTIEGIALHWRAEALLVGARDGRGAWGWAEAPADPEVSGRILALASGLLGRSAWSADERWRDRPRQPGAEWLAFAALDSACFELAAVGAGLSVREWLGGTAREPGPWRGDELAATVEPGEFDRLIDETDRADAAAIVIDPRQWGIGAVLRLDGWCRVRQVEIGLDARGAGPIGLDHAVELAASLPMTSLGIRADEPALALLGGNGVRAARAAYQATLANERPFAVVGVGS